LTSERSRRLWLNTGSEFRQRERRRCSSADWQSFRSAEIHSAARGVVLPMVTPGNQTVASLCTRSRSTRGAFGPGPNISRPTPLGANVVRQPAAQLTKRYFARADAQRQLHLLQNLDADDSPDISTGDWQEPFCQRPPNSSACRPSIVRPSESGNSILPTRSSPMS